MSYKCKYCGREFEKSQQLGGHVTHCKLNPDYKKSLKLLEHCRSFVKRNEKGIIFIHKDEMCECQYCHKQYKLYGLKNHEKYCDLNPNKQHHPDNFSNTTHRGGGWNKGLTKETDERVKKQGETYKKRYNNGEIKIWCEGKHLTEEHKKKISDFQKKYYNEHPDKVPYKLWHSSKVSYPEQYFKEVFEKESIPLQYHLQVGPYELDFYNKEYKIYVEIDGDTHKQKKVQEIDDKKDKYLCSLGWRGMRICWADYQKLSREEKESEIYKIRDFITKNHW